MSFKRLFLRHYLTVSAFSLGLSLAFLVGSFVASGLKMTTWANLNFYRAAIFGIISVGISSIGGSIKNDKY